MDVYEQRLQQRQQLYQKSLEAQCEFEKKQLLEYSSKLDSCIREMKDSESTLRDFELLLSTDREKAGFLVAESSSLRSRMQGLERHINYSLKRHSLPKDTDGISEDLLKHSSEMLSGYEKLHEECQRYLPLQIDLNSRLLKLRIQFDSSVMSQAEIEKQLARWKGRLPIFPEDAQIFIDEYEKALQKNQPSK